MAVCRMALLAALINRACPATSSPGWGGAALLAGFQHEGRQYLAACRALRQPGRAIAGAVATMGNERSHGPAAPVVQRQKGAHGRRHGFAPDGIAKIDRVVGGDIGQLAGQRRQVATVAFLARLFDGFKMAMSPSNVGMYPK